MSRAQHPPRDLAAQEEAWRQLWRMLLRPIPKENQ
jgi:hypothetical protein